MLTHENNNEPVFVSIFLIIKANTNRVTCVRHCHIHIIDNFLTGYTL